MTWGLWHRCRRRIDFKLVQQMLRLIRFNIQRAFHISNALSHSSNSIFDPFMCPYIATMVLLVIHTCRYQWLKSKEFIVQTTRQKKRLQNCITFYSSRWHERKNIVSRSFFVLLMSAVRCSTDQRLRKPYV